MVTRVGRWVHMVAVWLFAAGVIVQAFLAGQALSQLGGSGNFESHIEFGYAVMGLLALAVLVSALIGRVPRMQVGLSILLFILYIVQTGLPSARTSSPLIAALHPANAMLLLLLAVGVGRRARTLTTAIA
jgi:hypothetical protein